ncbi:amino acid adenylation domain-containing protein [Clostridium saccharoperbutylacetonicum]|uniref:amino acid adenylation domain-containing protein n=1 Tax=Clostridium saccharoperbutylacetonicum TaxID=36745 RepID=UPI0039E9FAD6
MDNIDYIFNFTPLQEGILFHKFYDETSTSYFLQKVFSLNGKINMDAFNKGLQCLTKKHDILRAIYIFPKKSERPLQVILREKNIEINEVTVNSREEIEEIKQSDIKRGFDLSKDSLLRVTLIHLSGDEHVILWSSHHIIMDGWCLSIVFGDFMSYYNRLAAGVSYDVLKDEIESDKNDRLRFCDYVSWIEKQSKKKALDYWTDLLDGYNEAVTVPPLQPKNNSNTEPRTKEIFLKKIVTTNLKKMATEQHVTLNTVIETAWGILLQKYNYCDDVVFGKIVSGRNAELPGIERAIGLYINTIPSRVASEAGETIGELVVKMQKQALTSMKYEYSPLTEIQSRSLVGRNLIQTLFVFENYYIDEEALNEGLVGLNIKLEDSREEVNYAMTMTVSMPKDKLSLNLMYDASIYTDEEAERVLEHLEKLLEQMSVDQNVKVSDLEIVTDSERDKIFDEFNNTKVEFPEDKTVVDSFEEQVEKTPENIALICGEGSMTYAKLNEKANQLAHKLRSLGVGTDDFVAIMAKRSIEMIVGIIGTVKAGGAYVPIDSEYPTERINYMLMDCKPKVILVYDSEIPEGIGIPILDLAKEDTFAEEKSNPEHVNTPNDLIYTIYTSGTTGNPKGVMNCHQGIVNLISFMQNEYPLNEDDVILQKTTYVFDVSASEIFWWFYAGAKLAILKKDAEKEPEEIAKEIEKYNVTVVDFVPSMLSVFISMSNQYIKKITGLKHVLVAGEALNAELVRSFYHTMSLYHCKVRLSNIYGPTEASVYSTYYNMEKQFNDEFVPIGRPVSNAKVYIVNQDKLCGIGVPGELCITGKGLARGYLNQPELTEEKFVINPFGEGRMYRTGDLARWLPNGNIEYLGRMDDQVKIRGFRIELGEIERRLREIENVKDCTVVEKVDMNGGKAICVYVVSDQEVDARKIKEELAKNLPDYMLPSYIMQIEKIPVTRNGKLDKHALPNPEFISIKEYVAPETDEEKAIAEAFQEILGVKSVGIDDDFFEMGGDSIKAIRVVSKMREKGYDLAVKDVILYRTARAMREKITISRNDIYEQGELTGKVKLTPIQQEFFNMEYKRPNHFNQALVLNCKERIDYRCLEATLKAVVSHHDMLRSVYHDGKQKILSVADSKLFMLSEYDIKETEDYDKKITEVCGSIQESIDLEGGPLFKAALVHTLEKDYLFLCIHHLVIDGISWRILLEDVENGYYQVREGREIKLPRKTASYKEWSENLSKCTKEGLFDNEVEYWDRITKGMGDGKIFTDLKEVKVTIDEKETEHFIKDCTKAFGTEINDLLLTALGQAYRNLTGEKYMTVDLESHGRESVGGAMDIDRTVGWFTSIYPVRAQVFDDMSDSIIETKEALRMIPNHGIGYGGLKYLRGNHKDNEVKKSDICFNYLGDFGVEEKNLRMFSFSDIASGNTVAIENGQTNTIAVFGGTTKGKMTFTISYATDVYSEVQMKTFAKDFKDAIEEVIKTCMNQKEPVKTASDYDLKLEKELLSQGEKYITNYEHNECLYTYNSLLLQSFFLEDHSNIITKIMHVNEPATSLQDALLKMVESYGSLRTRYNNDTKMFEEYNCKEWNIPILSGKGYNLSLLTNAYQKMAFNIDLISVGKLLSHIIVVELSGKESLVMFTVHHAIWDRMSDELFEDILNEILQGNKISNYSYAEYCMQVKKKCNDLHITDRDKENMRWITDKKVILPFEKAYSPGIAIQFKYSLSKEENDLATNHPIEFSSRFLSSLIQKKSGKYMGKEPVMIAHHNRNHQNSNILGMVLDVNLCAYDEGNETLLYKTSDTEYIMEKYVSSIQTPNINDKIFMIPTINYTGIMATDETFIRNNSNTLEVNRLTGVSMKGILLECSINEGYYHGAIVGMDCSYDDVLKAIEEAL